jgi:Uma2 family endonuclease
MSAVTTLPFSRAFTYDDLADMPEDGHRYELIDGVLIVSPAPVLRHQRTVGNLHLLLRAGCPPDLEVLLAPFDVVLAADTVLLPDLIVARRSDLTEKNLPTAPVLAVEVLSPSTRRFDLTVKHSRLEAAGCAHYLVVDPFEPSMIAWTLRDGSFVEVARASGDQLVNVDLPYPIALVPTDLVSG